MELVQAFSQADLLNDYLANGGDNSENLGMCMRLAFKFAALSLAGEDFKYDKVNVKKTLDKQKTYALDFGDRLHALHNEIGDFFDFTLDETMEAFYALSQATDREYIAAWSKSFTAKKGEERTEYSLSVGEPFDGTLVSYLGNRSIKEGEGVLISFNKHTQNKQFGTGHTMALIGGKPPYFFDPNQGLYEIKSNDPGREVREYLNKQYSDAEDFTIIPLSDARKKTLTLTDELDEEQANIPKVDADALKDELQERELDYDDCTKTKAGGNHTYAGSPACHNIKTNDLYLLRQNAPNAKREIIHISAEQHGMSIEEVQRRVKAAGERRSRGVADIIAVHTRTPIQTKDSSKKVTKKSGRKKT